MASVFEKAMDTHRLYGHHAFIREAKKNHRPRFGGTTEIFIQNVCTNLNCKEK